MSEKQTIVIEIQDDGSVTLGTDIVDKVLLRNTIRLAEELVIADALKKASVQPKIVPVHSMPKLVKAN